MGRLIILDFNNKQMLDPCITEESSVFADEIQENDSNENEKDSDLLMITIKLSSGIKNSFRFLANLEKTLVGDLTHNDIGQYVGWDCNQESVSLYLTGNTATLYSGVVFVLQSFGLTSENVEIFSNIQGQIPW